MALQAYAQQPPLAVPRKAPALSGLALAESELTLRAQWALKASDGAPAETRRSLTRALQTAVTHLRSLVQTGAREARAQRGQALRHLRELAMVGVVRRRRAARRHQLLTLAVRSNNLKMWVPRESRGWRGG